MAREKILSSGLYLKMTETKSLLTKDVLVLFYQKSWKLNSTKY
jgi:hypothetical protein